MSTRTQISSRAPERTRSRTLALALIPALCAAAAPLPAWVGTLPDGAEVRVDPDTHKATRFDGHQTVPLWDGVHRMEDGTVVIVRDGTVVPSEAILEGWEATVREQEALAGQPCELLERRACGRDNSCAAAPDCLKARRLKNLEREHQRRAPIGAGPHPATEVGNQCGAALADPTLVPCAAVRAIGSGPAPGPSPCLALVERVCGTDGHCAAAPAVPRPVSS